jgi:hypothetical protein
MAHHVYASYNDGYTAFNLYPNCSPWRMTVYPNDGKVVDEFGQVWNKPVYPSLALDGEGCRQLFKFISREDIQWVAEEAQELHVQYKEGAGGVLARLTRTP